MLLIFFTKQVFFFFKRTFWVLKVLLSPQTQFQMGSFFFRKTLSNLKEKFVSANTIMDWGFKLFFPWATKIQNSNVNVYRIQNPNLSFVKKPQNCGDCSNCEELAWCFKEPHAHILFCFVLAWINDSILILIEKEETFSCSFFYLGVNNIYY